MPPPVGDAGRDASREAAVDDSGGPDACTDCDAAIIDGGTDSGPVDAGPPCTSNADCDDMNYCDGVEECRPGATGADARGCVRLPGPCDDEIDCTMDLCDESTHACTNTPTAVLCGDGVFCNGEEACDPTAAGADARGCLPGAAPDCRDAATCTTDRCDATADVCVHDRVAARCGDGLFCNGVEACDPSAGSADPVTGCATGPAPNCNDGFTCTTDFCDATTNACTNIPNHATCDDARVCNGAERCAPGAVGADPTTGCDVGTPPRCDDGISCTTDLCDPTTDGCVSTPTDSICSDGSFCNGPERCTPGATGSDMRGCSPGIRVDCSDPYSCTSDFCDETGDRCVHSPLDAVCDDTLFCSGVERCTPGSPGTDTRGCATGTPVVCVDDGFSCSSESCNEVDDRCDTLYNSGVCPTGQICTAMPPDPASGCRVGMTCTLDSQCSDGNVCNGAERCSSGRCVAGTTLTCSDSITCTADSCDPVAGCRHVPSDALCDNGRACDGSETCDAAIGCMPGAPPSCNDGIPCTMDSCSDAAGGCVHTTDDAVCSDGRFCTGTERCTVTVGCVPGTPPTCGDSIDCTNDACNTTTDRCEHTPQHSRCDNGGFCDGVETCSATVGCQAGTAINCNDGIACSLDMCNEVADRCENTLESSLCPTGQVCTLVGCQSGSACTGPTAYLCDDGQFCNGLETCSSSTSDTGVCQAGTAPVCNDANACTLDSCSNSLGRCTFAPRDRDLDGYGDSTCGGPDCNDLDPAIHPGATDSCDGIDNDCDGRIDQGRRVLGSACTLDSDCCTGSCASGVCVRPDSECFSTLDTCTTSGDCCSGLCGTSVDGVRRCQVVGGCGIAGTICVTAADCCSSGCVSGRCSDTVVCRTVGGACTTAAQCCSNRCSGGVCQSAGSSCQVSGETCSSSGNCCSGFCIPTTTPGVYRCASHDTCRAEGEICSAGADCCTGGCASDGRCAGLGSCSTSGEPCTGTRSCCSALCVDAGSGVAICEHLPGCRPYGEVCTSNAECCSDECDPPDAYGIRRCNNPPGCVDAGEICGQGGSDDCCVLRHRGCTPTGLGVSRCNDHATCIPEAGMCDFSEQCCDGRLCVLDASGVRRCSSSCVATGGRCLSHADCCGGTCLDGFCTDASGGCVPLGGFCTAGADCCSGFCLGGICASPGD